MSVSIEETPNSDISTTEIIDPLDNDQPKSYGRVIFWWVMGALAVLVAVLIVRKLMGYTVFGPQQFSGFVLEAPAPIGDFTLTDHNGKRVSLSDFRGQVVLIYFGYAACPDVCPMTMLELKKARASLKENQQEDVQVLMVTVDPERDSPDLLKSYLGHFDPTFLGLTGTQEEIASAAAPFGIFYERRDVEGASGYFMDHTASVILVDKKGQLRLVWPFGMRSDEIASDLTYFVRER